MDKAPANPSDGLALPIASALDQLALQRTWQSQERTMLSWIRTGIALIGFGFGLEQIFRALFARDDPDAVARAHALGLTMVVAGLATLALAIWQTRVYLRDLGRHFPPERGYPRVPPSWASALAAIIALLGLLALADMLFAS
jgi:putative membrane protein